PEMPVVAPVEANPPPAPAPPPVVAPEPAPPPIVVPVAEPPALLPVPVVEPPSPAPVATAPVLPDNAPVNLEDLESIRDPHQRDLRRMRRRKMLALAPSLSAVVSSPPAPSADSDTLKLTDSQKLDKLLEQFTIIKDALADLQGLKAEVKNLQTKIDGLQ